MSKIVDRYADAIRSDNLLSKPATVWSDSDVLGAAGYAGKDKRILPDGTKVSGHALGIALLRLFAEGGGAAPDLRETMIRMLVGKAFRLGDEISEAAAAVIALGVLDWHRHPACTICGGHGFKVAIGTLGSRAVIGDVECDVCHGEGRRPFSPLFPESRLELAWWMRNEVERETAMAGPAAMAALVEHIHD
jgi:hypothetical protein